MKFNVKINIKRKSNLCNLQDEEWKPIKGFENLYLISNKGRLKDYIEKL